MTLSILVFNLGIELMQLLVITLTIPWLMLLSRTPAYRSVRLAGALLAAVAAMGWAFECVTGQANVVSKGVELVAGYAPYALVLLVLLTLYLTQRMNRVGAEPRASFS